jgi:integrase
MAQSIEREWQVVTVQLPGGEEVPTLVDARTWLPARVAQRYVMRERRLHVQPNTIRNELYAIARIYRWFWNAPPKGLRTCEDFDDFLVVGGVLTARQLDALVEHLGTPRSEQHRRSRGQAGIVGGIRPDATDALHEEEEDEFIQAETLDRYARAAKGFLAFALDAAKRGGSPAGDWNEIRTLREQLEAYFELVISTVRPSVRIRPLSAEEEEVLLRTFGPVYRVDATGARLLLRPVRFLHAHFTARTRLRNWLMYRLARDCGLRRGEILKLTLEDVLPGRSGGLKVVRRPDDPHDPRLPAPAVKTKGRTLPTTPELDALLSAYLCGPPPGRRVGGRTHYLITSLAGHPLSLASTAELMETFRRHSGIEHLRWHSLRHTWAESFIADCFAAREGTLRRDEQEQAFDRLRYAGGWHSDAAPRHYIQNWIDAHTEQFMRERNERLYEDRPFEDE